MQEQEERNFQLNECTSIKEREKKDTNSMWNLVNKLIIYDASLPAFRILEKLERINF